MKNFIYALFFMITCVCSESLAQQITIHSPTAANLGLYGEIPVSYYTGTPNISIPLYVIKGKSITVPIDLTYHPAGIRPEIHPGSVGLGWSLQAGGMISRTVRGNSPDESEFHQAGSVEGYLKYKEGWLAKWDWKENAKKAMQNNCFACRNTVHNMAPFSDTEPDEFSFSFLGISGKFYFDHKGQIQVQCDNPVKVVFNNEFIKPGEKGIELDYSHSSTSHRAFKSFIIVDEHGTSYHFGGANAIEFSDPISYGRNREGSGIPSSGQLLQATAWFLTQIKTVDGADVVNFEYERGPFVSQLYRSVNSYSYSGSQGSGWGINNILIDGTLMSPVYLKSIARLGGEVVTLSYGESNDLKYHENDYRSLFHYSSADDYKLLEMTSAIPRLKMNWGVNKFDRIQWLKLDTILVKNGKDEILKRIDYTYNNKSSERLFLESINIYGSTDNPSNSPMKYAFSYKNRNLLPAKYLTCITDHWGFNNGRNHRSPGSEPNYKDTDQKPIDITEVDREYKEPNDVRQYNNTSKISSNFLNREPNEYYTDSGVLYEICYPTNGTVQFEYELHDYAKVVDAKNRSITTNQSGKASGLRVKRIASNNLMGNRITRDFFYKESPTASVSSGILNVMPKYSNTVNGKDCDGKTFNMSKTRSMPVIPLNKDNGGLFLGYTYVCEQVSGGNDGYTQYQYTNHDNGHNDFLLSNGTWNRDIFPSDPHCSRFFERGRLKKETLYNKGGQPMTINETIWNRYGSQGEDNPRAFYFEGLVIGYDYCSTVGYLQLCYKFLPSQKINTVYDFNGKNKVTTQTIYEYNSYNLIKKVEQSTSSGSTQTQEIKYPSDFQLAPYTEMISQNRISPVIEKISTYNNRETERTKTIYFKDPSKTKNLILPEKIMTSFSGVNNLRADVSCDLYGHKGNICQYTTNDGISCVYLWSYSSQYPIAEIKNATLAEVNAVMSPVFGVTNADALSLLVTPNEAKLKDGSLQRALPNAIVTTYTYKPLIGMQTATSPNGVTTYYEYDSFGRLQFIKDHNGKIIEQYYYNYKNK